MADAVRNNQAARRFELESDGHIAGAYYELAGNIITFTHTEVPKALEGKGIGSRLVKGALDQARDNGLKVVTQCPFVKAYMSKHTEYGDLRK